LRFDNVAPCSDIIRNGKDLPIVLIERQVVITEVRLPHLSMEIFVLEQRLPVFPPKRTGEYKSTKQLPVAFVM